MAILTLQEFGKPFVVLDGSKISAVTCVDIQKRVDHPIPAGQHRFMVRVVCGGGVLDIGFEATERANWSRAYHTLVAALYREAGQPMTAIVPPARTGGVNRSGLRPMSTVPQPNFRAVTLKFQEN